MLIQEKRKSKMKNYDVEQRLLKDLFYGDNFYRIPDYQRPFSWDEEHFENLIKDLIEFNKTKDHDEKYFLGTIVLHKNGDIYDIVDGQQRLTSLLLLYSAFSSLDIEEELVGSIKKKLLQEKDIGDNIPERYRLEVRTCKKEFEEILNGNEINSQTNSIVDSYIQAKKIFISSIEEEIDSSEGKGELYKRINNNCEVLVIKASDFENAYKMFSIVNDRGLQLTSVDIIKSRCITPEIQTDANRDGLARRWEAFENDLGKEAFENIFHLIRFSKTYKKSKLNIIKEFDKLNEQGKIGYGESFVNEVLKWCNAYQELFIDGWYHADNKYIGNLLLSMNEEFPSNEWKSVIINYYMKENVNFDEFVEKFESTYLYYWLQGARSEKRFDIYGKWIGYINQNENISSCFDAGYKNCSDDLELFLIKGNAYKSPIGRYLLKRYELRSSDNDTEKKLFIKSVEHILPQTPKDESQWKKDFDKESLKKWVHNIANLVPLNKSKNSELGNNDFKDKREKYLKARKSDFITTNDVMSKSQWTPKELQDRLDNIIQVMCK